MKTIYQVPMEQFGFLKLETENLEELTPEAIQIAVEGYKRLTGAAKADTGVGIKANEFNAALDEYLATETLKNGTEVYMKMNLYQQSVFQEVKRALKRIKSRE